MGTDKPNIHLQDCTPNKTICYVAQHTRPSGMWHTQDNLACGTLHKDYMQDGTKYRDYLLCGTTQKPIKHVAQNTKTICCVAQHTKTISGSVFSIIFVRTLKHKDKDKTASFWKPPS